MTVRKAVASGMNGVGGGILGGVIDLCRLRDCADIGQRGIEVGVGGPIRRLFVKLRSDREAAILFVLKRVSQCALLKHRRWCWSRVGG